MCATCLAFKAVTAVDDLRKDFSSAHNHTRQLVSKVGRGRLVRGLHVHSLTPRANCCHQGAIPVLISVAKAYSGDLGIMVAAMGSLKNLATNEDSVNQIVANKGLDLTVAALRSHMDNIVSVGMSCMSDPREPSGMTRGAAASAASGLGEDSLLCDEECLG